MVMAFDETGQAASIERRIAICKRAHKLLTDKLGCEKADIVFDLNTFAIATGIAEHNNNAANLVKSIKLVRLLFPAASIVAGISNLSFAFRGSLRIRKALHTEFLKLATRAGLNMAIVNVQDQLEADELRPEVSAACRSLILNINPPSIEEVVAAFRNPAAPAAAAITAQKDSWRSWNAAARIKHAVVSGLEKHIEDDSKELALKLGAIQVIEGALMDGMNAVGKLFGDGKMFLSQIVKSARVMKKAVSALTPLIKKTQTQTPKTVVIATVKGDVHDIGKSIVATVLSCNNYKILDLGIMVPAEQIAAAASGAGICAVGLSGLISPSLEEMIHVAKTLQARGCRVPLLIGGATTSKLHTAVKLYHHYPNGVIVHVSDASRAVETMAKLTSRNRSKHINDIKSEYSSLAKLYARSKLHQNKLTLQLAAIRELKPKRKLVKAATITG